MKNAIIASDADFVDANPVTFSSGGRSLWDLLALAAVLTDGVIDVDGASVMLIPAPEAGDNEAVSTRTFQVRSDFQLRLADLVFGINSRKATDSPAEHGDTASNTLPSVIESLQALGLEHGGESWIELSSKRTWLTVRSSASELRKIAHIIEVLNRDLPQVNIVTKLVQLMNEQVTDDSLFTDPEYVEILQDFIGRTGTDLSSAPTIVTRGGQHAKSEFIKELLMPDPTQPGGLVQDKFGLILEIVPRLEGEEIRLIGSMEIRLPPVPKNFDESGSVTSFKTEFDALLRDGMTARLRCEGSHETRETLAFISVALIDPSGMPLR